MRGKKAQLDVPVVSFFVAFSILIIIGIVVLKVLNSVQTPLSDNLGNLSESGSGLTGITEAKNSWNFILGTGSSMWAQGMVLLFFILILIMLVSSFLINTNPFWIFLYIFATFFLVIVSPSIIEGLQTVYDNAQFTTEKGQLGVVYFIIQHYAEFLVGLIVISGIIIYGKISIDRGVSNL